MVGVSKKEEDVDDFSDIPIEHLDYKYIDKCGSRPELERILRYLKSGKEGTWPDLERACEDKMLQLMPERERMLYLARTRGPSPAEVTAASDELSSFLKEIQQEDEALMHVQQSSGSTPVEHKHSDIFDEETKEEDDQLPPIRNLAGETERVDSGGIANGSGNSGRTIASSSAKEERLKGNDWEAWDKYDVEKEIAAIEEDEARKERQAEAENARHEEKARVSKSKRERYVDAINPEGKPPTVRKFMGRAEKEKGNECFKAGEYEEAFTYYSAAIKYLTDMDATAYTNRAAAALKLGRLEQAERDCTNAIEIDAQFVKAFGRRGIARHKRGKYLDAIADFEHALSIESSNKNLNRLLAESRKMYNAVGGIGADRPEAPPRETDTTSSERFTRLTIIEDDDETDEEESSNKEDENGDVKTQDDRPNQVGDQKTPRESDTETKTRKHDDSIDEFTDWVEAKKVGAALYTEKKFDKGLAAFQQAVALLEEQNDVENRVKCLGNCAACLKEMGNFEGVVESCNKVLELEKDNIKAHMRKGLALEELGKLDDALTSMCDVLRIEPDYAAAATGIERLMAKLNGTYSGEASSAHETEVVKLSARDKVEALKGRANAAFGEQNFDEAEQLYTECLTLNDKYTVAYANRAAVRLKTSKYKGCVEDCTKGLKVCAEGEQKLANKMRYRRALANEALGNVEAALDDVVLLQQHEPHSQRCQDLLKRLRKRKAPAKPTSQPKHESKGSAVAKPEVEEASAPAPEENNRSNSASSRESVAAAAAEARERKQRSKLEKLAAKGQERVSQAVKANTLPIPKNFLDFERTWKQLRGRDEERGILILKLSEAVLKRVFKVEIPETILMDIFKSFSLQVVRDGQEDAIIRTLTTISGLRRFNTTVAFLTKPQQALIRTVLLNIAAQQSLVTKYLPNQ